MNDYINKHKTEIAIFIAFLFHFSGAMGILFSPYKSWFVNLTPLNLTLMFILLVWTHEGKHLRYWIYFLFVFLIGMIVEIIGTHTGMLFGTYAYTNVLGVKCFGVPLLIGLNWFVTLTTCSITINTLWDAMLKRVGITLPEILSHKSLSLVIDSAFLAVAFDATIEPVAKKLDFWQWKGGEIPFYNYVCWFLISLPLLYIYNKIGFSKKNEFAPHLLIIQTLFFITLNMFL